MSLNYYWGLLSLDMVDAYGASIDALTITNSTSQNKAAARAWLSETAAGLANEFWPYEQTKRVKVAGSWGWKRGEIGFANDKNYSVMAVTGKHSMDALEWVLSYDDNLKCSRIDLALDVMLKTPCPNYASDVYERAPKPVAEKMRLVRGSNGDTLYRNSRRSAAFGRCYDKSLDYGYEDLGTVWRFEVEVKRVKAQRLLLAIDKAGDVESFVKNVTAKQFRDWDIPMPIIPGETCLPRVELLLDYADNRMDWLKSMAPTIRTLANKREFEVREILNLPMFA